MPLHMALPGSVTLSSDSDSGTSAGAVKILMPLLPAMKLEDFNNAQVMLTRICSGAREVRQLPLCFSKRYESLLAPVGSSLVGIQ